MNWHLLTVMDYTTTKPEQISNQKIILFIFAWLLNLISSTTQNLNILSIVTIYIYVIYALPPIWRISC